MNWTRLPAGDLQAHKGQRYRATVSLGTGTSKQQVQTYLQGHGWGDLLLYDAAAGDHFPGDWGDQEVRTSDTSRRILRGEGTRLEDDTTIPESSSFPASLFVHFDLLHVYMMGPTSPAVVPSSGGGGAGKVWAFFGGVLVLGALGAGALWYTSPRRRHRR
ncbi:MAG: hypothetical protein ACHQC8_06545 [Solirubrobacterales bacterium]